MKFSIVASVLLNIYTALAADVCDKGGYVTTSSNYIIYNNLWGMGSATSGSQCTGLDSASGDGVAWHTGWSWAGGQGQVKSFANANLIFTPKTVANIKSIESTIEYSYTGMNGAVANVAYDIFTASTAGSKISDHEIMVWLAAYGGAGPISSTGKSIATVTIGGYQWRLYDGYNGSMHVYSFVAVGSPLTYFTGDLKLFLTYLASNYGLPTSQYVNTLQAGTEPFSGTNAKLYVSTCSIVVS
ncbi:concanavalin A-like lectin/glucanase domain-containing protein [Tuber borchii]|uniref:Concanavalin A-like lectin/glucanase domain-containing protein n=1 Tax=Tuber borchii TaxID=42251 RepID=A0A2T6ZH02_TUBBO|nr:concanavalin A-like lectin/glucanase domain-containing protein [Tuber borchii]